MWRPYNTGPAHDGLGLYCKNGEWTAVCDDSWRCDNGRLFCQKLGYAGVLSALTLIFDILYVMYIYILHIDTRSENYYGYYITVDHYAWSCTSSRTDLSQCTYYYHSSCNALHDQLGIICYSPIIGNVCNTISFNLAH